MLLTKKDAPSSYVQMNLRKRELMPHQKEALEYAKSTPHPALYMEMRLGKTKVAIEWLRTISGRVLVACPLSTVRSWSEELEMEGIPLEKQALLLGTTKERMEAFSLQRKWNLINYEGLLRCPDLLSSYRWGAIVLDESTRIKNPKAQITKLLCKYAGNADHRAILSGNPDPEGPLDFYEQMRFLWGQFLGFKNFWSFRNICFFPLAGAFKWTIKPSFKDRIKEGVHKRAFVLSRKTVGLANKKFYETRYIPMDPKQKQIMDKLEKEFVLETPEGVKETKWKPVQLVWMARLAGGYADGKTWFDGKFRELRDLLLGELKQEQVVVWFRFNSEIRHACGFLEKGGRSIACIDGTVDESSRARIRRDFMDGRVQILFIQQKVGMFGLDLSKASTAIYFSNGYSLEARSQSEDRIEHPFKKESLLIIDLVSEKTIDEVVVRALRKKQKESLYYLAAEHLWRKHAPAND